MSLVRCPGCGLSLRVSTEPLPAPQFHSSAECWNHYARLAAWTLSLNDATFPHQHAVDSYAAQHIGPETKPIAAVFALVGICLALEHNATGRQAQLAHMVLATPKRDWPRLEPRTTRFDVTVEDVLRVADGHGRLAALHKWMQCTWDAWAPEQDRIREIIQAEGPRFWERA
jgi:hypothetical protein